MKTLIIFAFNSHRDNLIDNIYPFISNKVELKDSLKDVLSDKEYSFVASTLLFELLERFDDDENIQLLIDNFKNNEIDELETGDKDYDDWVINNIDDIVSAIIKYVNVYCIKALSL
jgi:hypothetical protein